MTSLTYVQSDSKREKAHKLERLIYLSEGSNKKLHYLHLAYESAKDIYANPRHKDSLGRTMTKAKLREMKDKITKCSETSKKYNKRMLDFFKQLEAHNEYGLVSQYRKKIGIKKSTNGYSAGVRIKRW